MGRRNQDFHKCPEGFKLNTIYDLAGERPDQEPTGRLFVQASTSQVEQGIAIQFAVGSSVAALDVVSVNPEGRLGVCLALVGQK